MNVLILLVWILLMAFVFAKVEVNIEGEHGWAANLPTWRIEDHVLLDIFWGGRAITGYHVWMFLFMALAFHLPLILTQQFSLPIEARIMGSLGLFWIVEDFLWFVINPAFGIRRFQRALIPWHKFWFGPVPLDYVTMSSVSCILIWWSYRVAGI